MGKRKKWRNQQLMELWRSTGMTYREIGEKFGISTTAAWNVVKRELKREREARAAALDPEDSWKE